MIAPLTPVISFDRHIGTQLTLHSDSPLLLPGMSSVEGRKAKARSGNVHGAQRASQRGVETGPVTTDRKWIRQRRYAALGISCQPGYSGVVSQVSGSCPRVTRLAECHILHVNRVVIDTVAAADNHLGAELPGGRDPRQPHQFVLPRLARSSIHTRVGRSALYRKAAGSEFRYRTGGVGGLCTSCNRQLSGGVEVSDRAVVSLRGSPLVLHAKP